MNIFISIMEKIFPNHPAQAQSQPQPNMATTKSPAKTEATPIDVQSVLSQLAQKKSEKLNWQSSIVDLMKLLDMDSSWPKN